MDRLNRRAFLTNLASLVSSSAMGAGFLDLAEGQGGSGADASKRPLGGKPSLESKPLSSYKLADWKGDNPTQGHHLRDVDLPKFPSSADGRVDFVIIGGGMAGLSCAHFLKDHNVLLLEQYGDLGGQSRGSSFNGIGYSYGAAYLGELSGFMQELVQQLKLEPVTMDPGSTAWSWDTGWVGGVESAGTSCQPAANFKAATAAGTKGLYDEFKRLRDDCGPIWQELNKSNWLIPLPEQLARLDRTPFADSLKSYSSAFRALLDSYLRSTTCGDSTILSALAGYASLNDLLQPISVLPGGNPALARALAEAISSKGQSVCTNAFVWSVDIKDDGASVVYGSGDQIHRVDCRFVIVTAPPMVAARLLHGIDDADKAKMLSFKYGSYLVANLLLKKPVFSGVYDNFVGAPYSFSDIIIAETPYKQRQRYSTSMGSVLTVYQPYAPGTLGRPLLLAGDREEFAASTMKQMRELIGLTDADVQEIVLSRWGHAMAVPIPGFFKHMSALGATTSGAYALAHCSTQGMPCAEGAVRAALLASKKALALSAKTSLIFPRIDMAATTN